MTEPQLSEAVRADILRAFGLRAWEVGLAPAPWRVRTWRRLTFACRRGKAIDWEPYNDAQAEYLSREIMFEAELPGRMRDAADRINAALPGTRAAANGATSSCLGASHGPS